MYKYLAFRHPQLLVDYLNENPNVEIINCFVTLEGFAPYALIIKMEGNEGSKNGKRRKVSSD